MTRFILAFIALFMMADSALAQESDRARERENRDRIERLERQVRQMQERVYPDGRPASTAGYYDEPVATRSSVDILTGRVEALERQMVELVRASEESTYRLGQMEAEVARMRVLMEEIRATNTPPAPPEQPVVDAGPMPVEPDNGIGDGAGPPPVVAQNDNPAPPANVVATTDPNFEAAGEEAYIAGYRLWNDGNFGAAITQLQTMAAQYPGHRRVSWARNLTGRAYLDQGNPTEAARVFYDNYQTDPFGERAADSLYFLGLALVELGEPTEACRAYNELMDYYGDSMRGFLRDRLPSAMAAAQCS